MIYRPVPLLLLALTGLACGGSGYGGSKGVPSAGSVLSSSPKVNVQAGNNQSVTTGAAFATALQSLVNDTQTISNGDGYGGSYQVTSPVPGVVVTFTIVPGTGGAGGSFPGAVSTATATTNASGLASAPALTANGTTGPFTVTATATGYASATFNLTNL